MSGDRIQRLTLAEERRIDAMCERFEAAVAAGESPSVDALIQEVDLSLRPRLREELEALRRELSTAQPRPPMPGRRLGGYRIVQKIGEGGMGTVFEAVQETTRRRVALKIVRSDLGSERVRRRFEREARLLGHLHHPGIAQIFDAGVDEHADPSRPTPFLVMELIRGLPLIEHAEVFQLTTLERLELVRRVCGAVQHAHDQGIVHRDLKPANILVVDAGSGSASGSTAGRDESGAVLQGSPKVLDFGVARVLEKEFEASLETQTGQIVGTMAYMSPEQLRGESDRVDGRADVYALGVILYQLLAGRLPHDLSGRNLPSAIDLLQTVEPEPLGTVDSRLRGDIEIIVGKALEKRAEDRYRSAAALAADLQRHLDDVPIDARPPDTLDRIRKFARRNRGLFAGVVTACCALLVSLVIVSIFAWQQACLREAADIARAEADERQRIAAAVSEFLNDMMRAADVTDGGVAPDTTLREVLLAAADKVERSFEDHPPSRAAVHMALGASFLAQAEFAHAERQFRAALELRRTLAPDGDSGVAHAENSLAQCLEEQGKLNDAERHFRSALGMRRRLIENVSEATHEEALRHLLQSISNLAALQERRGNYDEALRLQLETRPMIEQTDGRQSPQFATHLNLLASIYERRNRFDEAEACYRQCVELRRLVLASPHPHLANALHNLGGLLYSRGRTKDAEALFRESLAMRLELFDDEHPHVSTSRSALAGVLFQTDRFEEALEIHRAARAAMARRLGEHHPDTLILAVNVGFSLDRLGRYDERLALMADVAPRLEQHYGASHQTSLWAMSQLGDAEAAVGNLERAAEIHRRTVKRARDAFGDHMRTAMSLLALAETASKLESEKECLESTDEALRILAGLYEPGSRRMVRTRLSRARNLAHFGRLDAASAALDANDVHLNALGEAGENLRVQVAELRKSIAAKRR